VSVLLEPPHSHLTNISLFTQGQAKDAFGIVFPSQKPKHVLEGTVQAVKSVLIGALLGAAFLMFIPIVSAMHGGIAGFIAGGIVGSILAFFTTLSGIVNGFFQLTRGILNTWSAVQAFGHGKIWVDNEWQEYSMQEEATELASPRKKPSATVKDESFYDLLGVRSDATSKEIKRSYYKKAKDVHPDKNPNDADAAEKFLKLHTAYTTLMDDQARAAYDKFGATPETGGRLMDPYVFSAILFGSQLVEPYIGELAVASFMDLLMKLSMGESSTVQMVDLQVLWDDSEFKSRKRQLEIAQNVAANIKGYVDGTLSAADFKQQCFLEAGEIGQTAFGTRFLASIGKAFQLEAGEYLGFHRSLLTWSKGCYYSVLRKKNKNWNRLTSLRKIIDVLRAAMQMPETNETVTKEESHYHFDASKANMQKLLPSILEMAWAFNEQDIAYTIHGACWRLFLDSSVSSEERLRRAEAIQILGNEFARLSKSVANAKTCADTPAEANEIMARLQVAFNLAQQKVSRLYVAV